MIDTDPQGNATSGLGINKDVNFSVYDVIINDVEIEKENPPLGIQCESVGVKLAQKR